MESVHLLRFLLLRNLAALRFLSFLSPQKRRLDDLVQRDSVFRVGVEELDNQAAGVGGEPGRALEVSFLDLSVHGNEIIVLERKKPGEEHVENDAARPDIGFRAVVAFLGYHLGSHVCWRSTCGVEETVGVEMFGEGAEAEVGDFEAARLVEEEIFQLQVAVEDSPRVAEINSRD